MSPIISFFSPMSGVGTTTMVIHTAQKIASERKGVRGGANKVLIVDCTDNNNATNSLLRCTTSIQSSATVNGVNTTDFSELDKNKHESCPCTSDPMAEEEDYGTHRHPSENFNSLLISTMCRKKVDVRKYVTEIIPDSLYLLRGCTNNISLDVRMMSALYYPDSYADPAHTLNSFRQMCDELTREYSFTTILVDLPSTFRSVSVQNFLLSSDWVIMGYSATGLYCESMHVFTELFPQWLERHSYLNAHRVKLLGTFRNEKNTGVQCLPFLDQAKFRVTIEILETLHNCYPEIQGNVYDKHIHDMPSIGLVSQMYAMPLCDISYQMFKTFIPCDITEEKFNQLMKDARNNCFFSYRDFDETMMAAENQDASVASV